MAQASNDSSGKSNRGFASMDPEKQRAIARKGGESVPNEKRSFSQDRSLAAAAGRKGGEASQGARKKPDEPPMAARGCANLRCLTAGRKGLRANRRRPARP
jgi:general stress protein YciG